MHPREAGLNVTQKAVTKNEERDGKGEGQIGWGGGGGGGRLGGRRRRRRREGEEKESCDTGQQSRLAENLSAAMLTVTQSTSLSLSLSV